jgi:uncharacterized protein involved in exopolysaccharide biosynthesis
MTERSHHGNQSAIAAEEAPFSDDHVEVHAAAALQSRERFDETSLIEILTQLVRRKGLIAKITGAAILVGVILCFLLPLQYTATAKIMPPQQTQSTASLLMSQLAGFGGNPLAAMAGSGLGLRNPNDIYVGLLNSRPIADAVIEKFNLASVYHVGNMTKARRKLASYTAITSEKSGFIAVSVTDKDRNRAAAMANAYTEQLRVLTKSLAVTEASQRRLFYEEQLKQSKDALVAAALAFQQVQQQKGLVQLDAQAKAVIESLATLRAQVAAKQVQVQALRSYSTEQNPEVQLAEKELAALEAEESSMEQRNRTPGFAGMGLENIPSAGLEYLRAQHELQYQQALYDMLMKQYDAARLDESKDAAIIQVVEPAVEPDMRSSPRRAMILILSAILGFLVGCMAALIAWWSELLQFDPHIARQLAEFRSVLNGRKAIAE